jgi:hypothetical protein
VQPQHLYAYLSLGAALWRLTSVTCLGLSLAALPWFLVAWQRFRYQAAKIALLEELLLGLEASHKAAASALKTVQQVEMVGRGYALGPATGAASRIEARGEGGLLPLDGLDLRASLQERSCPTLRVAVDLGMRRALHSLRQATLDLRRRVPLNLQWEEADLLLCDRSPESLGQ